MKKNCCRRDLNVEILGGDSPGETSKQPPTKVSDTQLRAISVAGRIRGGILTYCQLKWCKVVNNRCNLKFTCSIKWSKSNAKTDGAYVIYTISIVIVVLPAHLSSEHIAFRSARITLGEHWAGGGVAPMLSKAFPDAIYATADCKSLQGHFVTTCMALLCHTTTRARRLRVGLSFLIPELTANTLIRLHLTPRYWQTIVLFCAPPTSSGSNCHRTSPGVHLCKYLHFMSMSCHILPGQIADHCNVLHHRLWRSARLAWFCRRALRVATEQHPPTTSASWVATGHLSRQRRLVVEDLDQERLPCLGGLYSFQECNRSPVESAGDDVLPVIAEHVGENQEVLGYVFEIEVFDRFRHFCLSPRQHLWT